MTTRTSHAIMEKMQTMVVVSSQEFHKANHMEAFSFGTFPAFKGQIELLFQDFEAKVMKFMNCVNSSKPDECTNYIALAAFILFRETTQSVS